MKFTSRGFKAAAAVFATASLLGAGLLPAQAAPKTITVWADETRGPQLKSLIDGNTTIAPGYVIRVKFFASLTALQSAWDKATAAGGPDVLTGPASFNAAHAPSPSVFVPIICPLSSNTTVFTDLDSSARASHLSIEANASSLCGIVTERPRNPTFRASLSISAKFSTVTSTAPYIDGEF